MKATKPYFSHDTNATSDEKIIRLFFDFRKLAKELPENILLQLVSHGAYGLFWEIIEFLHENNLSIDEIDMLADELRIDADILKKILNDYSLFQISEGKYISERVLRNLKLQEEKSEKARASANKRHRKGDETPTGEKEELPEYDENIVMNIIGIYNDKFNRTQIVSDNNKHRIFDIHVKNNLTQEIWEKIFSNAKRGWDINGKKNVPPTLKKILEEWDSFASDDYFLAPDRDAIAKQEAQQKEQEELRREQERQESEKREELYRQKRNAINSKESALELLYEDLPIISHPRYVQNNKDFREFSEKYNFTIDEAMEYFQKRGDRNV